MVVVNKASCPLNTFPWLAILGLFIARRRNIGGAETVKVWGYPYVPIFYLIVSFALAVFTYINRPLESTAAVLTVSIGIPCYFLWRKRTLPHD